MIFAWSKMFLLKLFLVEFFKISRRYMVFNTPAIFTLALKLILLPQMNLIKQIFQLVLKRIPVPIGECISVI